MFEQLRRWWLETWAGASSGWRLSAAKRKAYAEWDDDKFLRSLAVRRRLMYFWVCCVLLVIFLALFWLVMHQPPPDPSS